MNVPNRCIYINDEGTIALVLRWSDFFAEDMVHLAKWKDPIYFLGMTFRAGYWSIGEKHWSTDKAALASHYKLKPYKGQKEESEL